MKWGHYSFLWNNLYVKRFFLDGFLQMLICFLQVLNQILHTYVIVHNDKEKIFDIFKIKRVIRYL